jgi:hypothetical protein
MAQDRKEYMRQLMAKKRAEKINPPIMTATEVIQRNPLLLQPKTGEKTPDWSAKCLSVNIPMPSPKLPDKSIFNGKGRGVPVNGYVLIASRPDDIIVTQEAWQVRLNTKCTHNLAGWSCKLC